MDLKLELSLKRDADELTSANFQLAKDRTGPLFQSKETETMFILTAEIRGYMREQIKIDINKDGTVITIGGEKSIEEMIMVGWKVFKKGIEKMKFRKAFRIPDGVILDNIKANFNEDENMLTILMPKKVKGIVGIGIEEMVEPELVRQASETLPATDKKIQKRVTFKEESITDSKQKFAEQRGDASSQVNGIGSADSQFGQPEENEEKEMKWTNQETPKPECNQMCDQAESKQQKDQDQVNGKQVHHEKESGIQENESALEKTEAQEGEQAKTEEPQKKSKIFAPLMVGGSAMLVSLVAFAIHATKTKNEHTKRKD